MQEWETFLGQLEQKIGKESVHKWLRCLKVVDFDACNLYLEAENSFQISWFEEHIRKIAERSFCNNNHHKIKIHFKKKEAHSFKVPKKFSVANVPIQSDHLDPSFTFAEFVSDTTSQITLKCFQELKLGHFNPLFLYGPSGVGKTHLFTATAHFLKSQGLSVFYVHAETFTQHVVNAIRNSQMEEFRKIYRNQDVLFIDDIHFLARRAATQEELFHTFNTLYTAHKQIFLSSTVAPNRLQEIEPRLISRFEWGLVLELPSLSSIKMREILQKRARQYNFPLLEATESFIIENFHSSTKSLMKAFDALVLRNKSNISLDPSQAAKLLSDLLTAEKKGALSPEKIVQSTALHFDLHVSDIMGNAQTNKCSLGRKIAMYFCRQLLGQSYVSIGKYFDRDHSTVISSCKFIEKNKDTDKTISFALEELKEKLES